MYITKASLRTKSARNLRRAAVFGHDWLGIDPARQCVETHPHTTRYCPRKRQFCRRFGDSSHRECSSRSCTAPGT